MRAVIQKVSHAHIAAADAPDAPFSQIPHGLCVLLGVGGEDSEADARYIADKIAHLRIFEDEAGKLNLSVKDTGGEVLLVSQFTLFPSRPPRTGRSAVSASGRPLARPRRERGRRPLPHPHAGQFVQRRAGNHFAGFAKNVLKRHDKGYLKSYMTTADRILESDISLRKTHGGISMPPF